MALSRDVVIRLLGDSNSAVQAQKAAADAAGVTAAAYRRAEREMDKQARASEAAAAKQRQAMDQIGQASVVMGTALVAGLGMAVKAAMDWESAWAGVTKTLPDDADFAATEKGLRELARTLPATHQEIAAVAEAAGQLGVAADAIVPFTKTMIDLGETTNLSADEAATSIAQMMNVMQTAPEDVGRLGSALVELGNNGASTEADIMKMTGYLVGAAQLIGATESDVLALANTMTSLGINAERGGGVMTRTMQDIYTAVQSGGEALDGFAEVAGMSAQEFAQAFEDDPIRAIGAFTDGLAAAKGRGDNVVEMLNDLGIKGTQDTAVLLQMAGAQGMVNENLDRGSRAWEDNNALVEEAAKRYDTTAAQMEIARNSLTEAGIEIGESLLPVLAGVAEGVADVAQWFADLPGPIKDVVGVLGGIAGVGGLAAGAFLLLAPRVAETYRAFADLRRASPGVASGLGKVGKAAGIAGVFIAATAAADGFFKTIGPGPATMEETTAALLGMADGMGEVNELFSSKTGLRNEIEGLAEAAELISDPGLTDRINDFGGSLGNIITFGMAGSEDGSAARTRVIEDLDRVGESLALVAESGNAELAAEQFDLLAAEWEKGGGSVDDLLELMPAYKATLGDVDNQQRLAAESARLQQNQTALLAENLDASFGSIEGYAAAMGYTEEQTEALVKKTEELGTALADFINPLGVYTTMLDEKAAAEEAKAIKTAEEAGKGAEAWREFVVDTGFSFDEYVRRLEDQVAAQTDWQTNMLILAGRVSQGTLDELRRMGPEGAPLVADLVNRSDEELARLEPAVEARSKAATDAWAETFLLATPVLAAIGKTAGEGVVRELTAQLMAGTITVAEIARQYGVNLAGGINPVLTALGKRPIAGVGGRLGGVTEFHDGGFTGSGGKYTPAGIVHAGEYVEPQEAVDYYGVGIFEALHRRQIPRDALENWAGYADGGLVALGREFQRRGATVSRHSAFDGRTPTSGHGRTSLHYTDNAIDVNTRPGTSALEQRELAPLMALARARGFRTIFMSAGHYNHGHVDTGRGGSIGGPAMPEMVLPLPPSTAPYKAPISTGADATMRYAYDAAQAFKGSIFNPHVRDMGGPLLPGYTYNGLNRPEVVVPGTPVGAGIPAGLNAGPLDLSDRTIAKLAVEMARGAAVAVGANGARQAINERSWA